jgi:hypothetical protein
VKYELETIPVWDAFAAETECSLCFCRAEPSRAEHDFVAFFLGSSVMAPEIRLQVNETGFCRPHFSMLLGGGNRLGLALMTHTHIGRLRKKFASGLDPAPKVRSLEKRVVALDALITKQLGACLICERLEERCKRYAFTIAHLWQHDDAFRQALRDSRGFCLDHELGVLQMAVTTVASSRLGELVADVDEIQRRAWDRLEASLLAFTGSFDYDASPGAAAAAKQAVPDAIQKLAGTSGGHEQLGGED